MIPRDQWNANARALQQAEEAASHARQLRATQEGAIETCVIVRPDFGGSDPYSALMATVPDISDLFAPQSPGAAPYDSMEGLPSPETLAAIAAGYPDPEQSDPDVKLWARMLRRCWGYRGDVAWSMALSEAARCRAEEYAAQVATLRQPFKGPYG